MLGRSYQIWQQDHRTASGTFGAILLAFGLALFLSLTPSGEAQAHMREFDSPQRFSSAKLVQSIADRKADRAASATTVLSASAPDDSGCRDGAAHDNCGLCAGGHCFGCSAAALAVVPDIGSVPKLFVPTLVDHSGLALTKPDEAFRPPRSVS